MTATSVDLDWCNHKTCYKDSVTKKRLVGNRKKKTVRTPKGFQQVKVENNSKFRCAMKQGYASKKQARIASML